MNGKVDVKAPIRRTATAKLRYLIREEIRSRSAVFLNNNVNLRNVRIFQAESREYATE